MGLRLDTRLSKYLLEHQLVAVEMLEDAVQQQVVHGGALDTLLLELGAIDEAALTAALTVAWDTDVVAPSLLDEPAKEAVATLPSRMAVAMGLCPVDMGSGSLHVAVAAPLDRVLLDEVGALVGVPLKPFVVPEVRLLQALHRAYDAPLEERFASLLRRLDGDSSVPDHKQLVAEAEEADATGEVAAAAPEDISPAAAATWDVVEALAHLAAQESREGIAQVAVSFALRFVPFAAVFGIRNSRAVGWHRAGPCEGAQFGAVELVIPDDSVVKQVLDSPSPLLGKPPITNGNSTFFGWVGRRRPRTALLIPIVVARRTVGVLYADGGVRPREIQFLSDLVSFGARIGPAFEALLRARHRATADLIRSETPGQTLSPARQDGTSPFAQGYQGPGSLGAPATPQVAPMPPPSASTATGMMPVDAATLADDGAVDADSEAPSVGPDIGFAVSEDAPVDIAPPAEAQADAQADAQVAPVPDVSGHGVDEQAHEQIDDGVLDDEEDVEIDPDLIPTEVFPARTIKTAALDTEVADDDNEDEDEDEWDDIVLPESTNLAPVERTPSTRIQLPELEALSTPPTSAEVTPQTPFAGLVAEEAEARSGEGAPAEDAAPVVESRTKTKPLTPVMALDPSALEPVDDAGVSEPVATVEPAPQPATTTQKFVDPATRPPQLSASDFEEEETAAVEILAHDERTETDFELTPDLMGGDMTLAGTAVPAGAAPPAAVQDAPVATTNPAGVEISLGSIEATPTPERPKTPEEWVEDLESLNASKVTAAKAELLRLGASALDALTRRFPGRLVVDPFGPGKRPTTPEQLGPLLEVVMALGEEGLFAAIPHLTSKHAARRYAAAFVFRLSLDERAIDLLPGLLHDPEPRIRTLAAETLAGLMAHPRFEAVLTGVRSMLKSPARDAQLRGVQLLGTFKDVASVPTLISFVEERHADLSLAARDALMQITLQDFGTKTRPWRKWWDKARKVSRIDWLIDGLSSKDRDIRKQAITELRALAGQDFGFRVDDNPKQRDAATQAFARWWTERKRAMGW